MRRRDLLHLMLAGAGLASRPSHAQAFTGWPGLVALLEPLALSAQLQKATEMVHLRMGYVADEADVWQTPLESFDRGAGDCEDFAIAKYALLRCAGNGDDIVRLGYGHTTAFGGYAAHMVCVALDEQGAGWMVLDNLGDEPRPLHTRSDLRLQFSFGERQAWLFSDNGFVATPRRLKRFEALALRMHEEGTLPSAPDTLKD